MSSNRVYITVHDYVINIVTCVRDVFNETDINSTINNGDKT